MASRYTDVVECYDVNVEAMQTQRNIPRHWLRKGLVPFKGICQDRGDTFSSEFQPFELKIALLNIRYREICPNRSNALNTSSSYTDPEN